MPDPDKLAAQLRRVLDSADEVDAAALAFEEAGQRLDAAKDATDQLLAQLAAEGHDPPALRPLARVLYWEYPQVHVAGIGLLLGCPTNLVAQRVGTYRLRRPCVDCGQVAEVTCHSRSELYTRDHDRGGFHPWRCSPCQASYEQAKVAERAARDRQWEAERAALAAAAQRRRKALATGQYEVAGQVVTLDDATEWIITDDGAEPVRHYPAD